MRPPLNSIKFTRDKHLKFHQLKNLSNELKSNINIKPLIRSIEFNLILLFQDQAKKIYCRLEQKSHVNNSLEKKG